MVSALRLYLEKFVGLPPKLSLEASVAFYVFDFFNQDQVRRQARPKGCQCNHKTHLTTPMYMLFTVAAVASAP
tara:strand:+ start:530 stop:748 length:219 start_codon:yes stop_codon:yes gene_type:complete